jgi:hypothetical protein
MVICYLRGPFIVSVNRLRLRPPPADIGIRNSVAENKERCRKTIDEIRLRRTHPKND